MEPIRVLHIVTYMGRGGLETMLMNYYRKIDRSKVQFDFLVHRDFEADYDKEIESLGGKIFRLPRLNPFSRNYLDTLDQFFKEHKEYKIVHSHLDCMAGIPLKYAKKNGVPCRIAHAHNSNQVKDKKYPLKLWYKRNITKYATKLFACGEEAGKWMFNGKPFHVLYNAIDAEKYVYDEQKRIEVRESLNIDAESVVVGHVGRFFAQKNHDFIIDIFEKIVKRNPQTILLLVGDGELQEEIKQKGKEKHLDKNVLFTGVRSDVPDLLQAMDVFLLPSLFEGLPLVMVEAQASGLPCLISERVPIECKKTKDLVYQFSLSEDTDKWAEKVLECVTIARKNTFEEISASGFDIKENAKWLSDFYLSEVSENE